MLFAKGYEKIKFLILFSLLTYGIDSFATNYYVSSKNGNDKYDGVSPRVPKKTIQSAANLTKPGDTVFVMNGTYSNECPSCNVVEVLNSGTSNNYIIYKNYPNHHPVIKFNGWAGISIINTSYIKIFGFEVHGESQSISLKAALNQEKSCRNKSGDYEPVYNGNGIAISGKNGGHPHHIVVEQNIVHNCGGGGISAAQADYVTFQDNLVYDNSWYTLFGSSGISFYQFWNYDYKEDYHNFIRRNKCFNNRSYVPWVKLCEITDGNGIIIDDFKNKQNGSKSGAYKGRTLVENNVCWYNGGTGIHTFQSAHVDIMNNTAYCNSQSMELNAGQILAGLSDDIKIVNNILVSDHQNIINSNYSNTNITYLNNLHYNITNPGLSRAVLSNSSCISGLDPMFVKPGKNIKANFNLSGNSPAINRANKELYSKGDFNFFARPIDKQSDIGAFEYHE